MIAEVLVDVPIQGERAVLDYALGTLEVAAGQRVVVPLGSRQVEGIVLNIKESSDFVEVRLISRVLPDWPLSEHALALGYFLHQHYVSPLAQAFRPLVPPGRRGERVQTKWQWRYRLRHIPPNDAYKRSPKVQELLHQLQEAKEAIPLKRTPPLLKLIADGYVQAEKVQVQRYVESPLYGNALSLNDDQQKIFQAILQDNRPVSLLHGVTGSGKTEIYLALIATALKNGQGSIVLVPEISLTAQTIGRFRERFGNTVAILHSQLSQGERLDEWQRIERGEARVVVGARSAVFSPMPDLAWIIVDEEHETSYKQTDAPRYHARDVAEFRARQEKARVILGSATPSLESFQRSLQGEMAYYHLGLRAGMASLPDITVADLRDGAKTLLSPKMQEQVQKRLDQGEQSILFLNRRGFSSVILCRQCGESMGCPHCSVSLTYHHREGIMLCHYCAYVATPPVLCPNCQSSRIGQFGAGTERLEQEVRTLYPKARVLRMDFDTTRQKGAHARIYELFVARKADILIGTQMIAKGLDFPHVTFVGIIAADMSLRLPDFRAAERTFQLVAQVAGRAGRASLPGEVLVQTFAADHYSLRYALAHDYLGFAQEELRLRQELNYPPFSHLVEIMVSGPDPQMAKSKADELATYFTDMGIEVLGPAAALLAKRQDRYHYQLYLRATKRSELKQAIAVSEAILRHSKNIQVRVTFDPLGL